MVKIMKVAMITHIASVASPPGEPPNGLATGAGAVVVKFMMVRSLSNPNVMIC